VTRRRPSPRPRKFDHSLDAYAEADTIGLVVTAANEIAAAKSRKVSA
jgi:hypothetical protein